MTTARDFFDNLSETLMPTREDEFRHGALCSDGLGPCDARSGCGYDSEFPPICHICLNSVTDSQLADGDAYVKDSAGNDDGEYEYRECGQSLRYEYEP